MILIGYSGHAYVVHGIFAALCLNVTGYCDKEEKEQNPFSLKYFGNEMSAAGLDAMQQQKFFIAIGDNTIRKNIYNKLAEQHLFPVNAVHPSAIIDDSVSIAQHGVMVSAQVTLNALARVGIGAICNTGCIIEHECEIGEFSHVGPGAILCGNVKLGNHSFVGAGSVVKEGIQIGNNVMIGAGSVVVKDIPDAVTVVGNPAQVLKKN
ncbi:MAG: acetyltransferase [Niastella sp.]|nr:acetyltransferase [Niastella sp.]